MHSSNYLTSTIVSVLPHYIHDRKLSFSPDRVRFAWLWNPEVPRLRFREKRPAGFTEKNMVALPACTYCV
jgi:hypothetical protein